MMQNGDLYAGPRLSTAVDDAKSSGEQLANASRAIFTSESCCGQSALKPVWQGEV